ncbi:Retrovirus-related Pol polyprotein from transposon RE1 [Vitis vinifera]|uniref:Retrovirus-related Pol polyprotein from transposon RE1 n=1 Tax=Vitis vinifera TaxID=29760 RepID=A0A438JD79_VITVI|nr:Retrovirus-related Pol polyprotein from transposon RE1 [Vitis vinifera]
MRQIDTVEGALQARMQKNAGHKNEKKHKKNNNKPNNNNQKNGVFPSYPHCKKTNHSPQKCWWRPDVKCNKCGKQGHVERICKNQQQEETSATIDQCQDEQLFAAMCVANKSISESWLVDSGCTNHMTNHQDLFTELDRTTISKVRIGNDRNCIIKDAKGKEVFNIKIKGKSFALNLLEDEHATVLQQDSTTMLWHRRLGHYHHDVVLYMKKNQIVEELSDLEKNLSICATCQYGKQTKLPFPKKTSWRATQKIQLVHTDVGGPQKTPSLKGVKRDKLDKQSEMGIFVRYSDTSKAYRIYLPKTNKIVVSRDVKFLETKKWSWDEKMQQYNDENVDELPVRGTKKFSDIYCNVVVLEPAGFEEAIEDEKWQATMRDELNMIEKNNTWELVDRLSHKKPIKVKGVYKTKLNLDGSINKYKARMEDLLAGCEVSLCKWLSRGGDFVEQPEGFYVKGKKDKVYLLKKALYGLKQAPRAWYSRIDAYMLTLGCQKSWSEFTLYIKKIKEDYLIVSLYVDDLLVTGNNVGLVNEFKVEMKQVLEMTDLGEMTYFLGIENGRMQAYINSYEPKEKFCKEDGAEKADEGLFRSMIGCLMYLTSTRPDIMYVISLLSSQVKNFVLHGYSDSDWTGCVDDMQSTSDYCFSFGSGIFSWSSKKQEVVAQSIVEAEYVAAIAAIKQVLWLRKL